jgi:hypothetical protein
MKLIRAIKLIPLRDYFNFEKLYLYGSEISQYTMSGYRRFSNIYDLSEMVEKESISGAFVECGVWKGGCAATMAYIARKYNSDRKIWLFDSFEGLPKPSEKDGIAAKSRMTMNVKEETRKCIASVKDIEEIFFKKLKIERKKVLIRKGWFQNVLPNVKDEIGAIAILRIDADWYESTKSCFDNLYDNVVPGGYVVIDDYGHWEGCRKAVDEFLESRNISVELVEIDYTGRYFKKP